MKLHNLVAGKWVEGQGSGQPLYDASTGEQIALADTGGLDFAEMITYGRSVGNPNLRKRTFHERGRMLKALALYLMDRKEKYYEISYKTGATRADSWIDIEGGIGNLFANASLRRKLPDLPYFLEGDTVGLSKGGTFIGHHVLVPKEGVAIHINAFNFPVWGMLEKCAVNWLAGMPAIVKPATLTSYLTQAVVQDIHASGILPEGALQIICGSAQGILDHVDFQDVVTFTGSASTGGSLRAHPAILKNAVPFNMEADSLNCIVLGEDAAPGTPEYDLFVKEVRREMIVKCGQKCTAVRRIVVPEKYLDEVKSSVKAALASLVVGDPRTENVRMGPLAGLAQRAEVQAGLDALLKQSELVFGDYETSFNHPSKGAFVHPMLLVNSQPFQNLLTHETEVFGPVSTILPYKDLDEACRITKLGRGSLCTTFVSNDLDASRTFFLSAATHHGRILLLNREAAKESTGHGSPMPMLVHGGPGRAGGGEEMGGLRGVTHYMQRCAIQGSPTMITHVTGQHQPGSEEVLDGKHPFKKHFEELNIGDTLITHKRTVTEADIVNFANVSWDHFYAHTDATSLDGTIFTKPVAHGYFVLSAAAGLFVDPAKGPVLLNYGLEECRFTKPVYAGMTIGVKLTVKEKIAQEKREDEPHAKGIVKWLVSVYDETEETVAIATILTMVKMMNTPQ
jgi:oxepin-CoA hydrolase/3-oxo-5,6-dehydrosuberyl-CoA semialdehyde dehydrogenase